MAGSDTEEEDYMSEKFLVDSSTDQEKTYTQIRKDRLRQAEQKAYHKSKKQLEEEAREAGLKKQMDAGNKGMQMLMKMGYK